jgi:hypothetical protein
MSPVRVQRKRTKGWKAPLCGCGCGETARYVGRGSEWGNPWKVGADLDTTTWTFDENADGMTTTGQCRQLGITPALAVALYRAAIEEHDGAWGAEHYLQGHDLMCWCPLDQPCHADVLLELANGVDR